MVLDKYIGDLLYRYECVIVPGFGGFITNKISAKNISSKHKFFPPTKEIAFNQNLNNNDGLLANYLVQAKKISYTHAIEIIESCVTDWQTLLDEDNTFDIKKVGSFRLNQDRNLQFTAVEDVNYLTESYGLSSFTSLAIKRTGDKAKVKPLNKNNPTYTNNSVNIRKYVRYAAIIIPFIAISTLSFYQINNGKDTPVNNAKISIIPENTIVEKPVLKIKNKESKVVIPTKTVVTPVAIERRELKYHVISGAFSSKSNAEKNVRILYSKGINAELIGINKKGLHMVSYQSFDNVKDAVIFMKAIKATDNSNAWVWKKSI